MAHRLGGFVREMELMIRAKDGVGQATRACGISSCAEPSGHHGSTRQLYTPLGRSCTRMEPQIQHAFFASTMRTVRPASKDVVACADSTMLCLPSVAGWGKEVSGLTGPRVPPSPLGLVAVHQRVIWQRRR